MTPVQVRRGTSPIVLGLPHTGTDVPGDIWRRLNEEGRKLRDTDWHVDRLYDGLLPDVTTVRATFHRYVIDANRDPSGASLYPGQNTTGLVPLTDFDNNPIWNEGPGEHDIARRLQEFHEPYHQALGAELSRLRDLHGAAILYDCHSIRSQCPFLFEGRLPDFNIGTSSGLSCASAVAEAVRDVCAAASDYSFVVDGRFRGGWTTRHYGSPQQKLHAIQMELAQSTHLESEAPPFAYSPAKSDRLRAHLADMLARLERLARTLV